MPHINDNERILYEALKKKILPNLNKTEDQFSKWDCVDDINELIVELKCRDDKYKREYGDFLIEHNKWKALKESADKLGYKPLYVNEHEGDVWIFNLNKCPEPKWKHLTCNAHTQVGSMGGKRVSKRVGFLPWEQASRFYEKFI